MINSILKLKPGTYVSVLIEKEWKIKQIIEIMMPNNTSPDGGVFMHIEFDDHSRYTIWNNTSLKFVYDTIKLPYHEPSTPPSNLQIDYHHVPTTTLSGVANPNYFNKDSYNSFHKQSSVLNGKDLPGSDDDLPEAPPIELWKETFGDLYRVNEKGERI